MHSFSVFAQRQTDSAKHTCIYRHTITYTCMLKNEEYAEMKHFRLMITIQLFCLVAVSYVAV